MINKNEIKAHLLNPVMDKGAPGYDLKRFIIFENLAALFRILYG
jgi:hypothetical protein